MSSTHLSTAASETCGSRAAPVSSDLVRWLTPDSSGSRRRAEAGTCLRSIPSPSAPPSTSIHPALPPQFEDVATGLTHPSCSASTSNTSRHFLWPITSADSEGASRTLQAVGSTSYQALKSAGSPCTAASAGFRVEGGSGEADAADPTADAIVEGSASCGGAVDDMMMPASFRRCPVLATPSSLSASMTCCRSVIAMLAIF